MEETRSILITHVNGKRKLVEGVPANAKVTYGPVQPGKNSYSNNCLRIYTSQSAQLGVFLDVADFRDLSLTVKEQVVKRVAKSDAVLGPNGQYAEDQLEVTYEWEEVEIY